MIVGNRGKQSFVVKRHVPAPVKRMRKNKIEVNLPLDNDGKF